MIKTTVFVPTNRRLHANHVMRLLGKTQNLNTYNAPAFTIGGASISWTSGVWTDAQRYAVQLTGEEYLGFIAQMVADERVPDDVDLALAAIANRDFRLDPATYDPALICAYSDIDDIHAHASDIGLTKITPNLGGQ